MEFHIYGSITGLVCFIPFHKISCNFANNQKVALTYLHHSDGALPHYNPSTWTFTRGAASTIDRDFGWVGRHIFHNIIETHVLHHHISIIPHYHSEKAAAAIKPVMGIHYKKDMTGKGMWNFMVNFWKNAQSCTWVEASEGAVGEGKNVLFFRNRIGVGIKPAKIGVEGSEKGGL
jgi:omega-6 fatty acid desaturase (delta-12 desaturase)